MSKTAGRNDPCPCGSGKKYKNCCWGKDLPKSDVSKRPLFASALTPQSSGPKRIFKATLIQGKTKDIVEQTFSREIAQANEKELPPVPPSLELPPQELPEDYKGWKKSE